MTNREAVKVLKSWIECLSTDCDNDCERCHIQLDDINIMLEACAVAITELSQIDDDTVSRKAVLNAIMSETKHYPSWYEERIKALPPSPTQSRQQGYWKGKPIAGFTTVRCSCCGMAFCENDGLWKYCPECGADMQVGAV